MLVGAAPRTYRPEHGSGPTVTCSHAFTNVGGNKVRSHRHCPARNCSCVARSLDVDFWTIFGISLLGCSRFVRTEPRRVREYKMESKTSEPCEGENIIYSHTPDGHERAGPRPAAVAGSDSGTVLRLVPASTRTVLIFCILYSVLDMCVGRWVPRLGSG